MNQVYFTADLHVGPYNRRTLQNRGFGTDWVRHMEIVRDSINETCDRSDLLYIGGDLGFKGEFQMLSDFIKSLRCRKKIVIGNHDDKKQLIGLKNHDLIEDVKNQYCFKLYNEYFHISHYPLMEWNHFFENAIHLHGHTHGNLPQNNLRMLDVGIDNVGYKPISANEVIDRLKNKRNVDEYKKRLELR